MLKFITGLVVALALLIIMDTAAAWQEGSLMEKKDYPLTIKAEFETPVTTGSAGVSIGGMMRLRVMIPKGVNQVKFRPASNTFQYGVRIGTQPSNLKSTSGSALMLYSAATVKSEQHYAYVYIDNSRGTETFTFLPSSEVLVFIKRDNSLYNIWRTGNANPPPISQPPPVVTVPPKPCAVSTYDVLRRKLVIRNVRINGRVYDRVEADILEDGTLSVTKIRP